MMRLCKMPVCLLLGAYLWSLPAAAESLGIGHPASAEDIARWDIDVRPDGSGLPAGQGSSRDGAPVYAARCAGCHGPTGRQGRDWLAGAVVADELQANARWTPDTPGRRTIGNYWPYATTLFDYIRRAMPPDAPGSLSDDECYALTAYLLHLNGIISGDEQMNAGSLPQVVMPARDRFIPDDRRGGAQIR